MRPLLDGLGAASASAAVLILAALVLRAAFQNRTPRRVFCLLWDVALARLLILAPLPSPMSIWRYFPKSAPVPAPTITAAPAPSVTGVVMEGVLDAAASFPLPSRSAVFAAVWLAAALALAAWFLWSHLRFRRSCADSLPCRDAFVRDWLHSRSIQIRTSDHIAAPLTYGILRPVILLPSGMDWQDRAALCCILEHEYQHIRRFDTLRKALLAAALCLHWFNPLVWALYVLSNRDMELACDEAVTAQGTNRADYARTLLRMEERRSQWGLSGSHFSQSALEERIRSIMKYKKTSVAALTAVLVVMGVTATVFASAAPKRGEDGPKSGYLYNHNQAVEGETIVRDRGGETQYSVDGGKTWLSQENYGSDWQVEWWAADEYAAWLEEEKQVLQSIIGKRGYTGSEGWFVWDQARVDEAVALYESILEEIKNGALYSKTITAGDGSVVEGVALGSGTLDAGEITAVEKDDTVATGTVDEAALLEELKAFGVNVNVNQMTYHGQSIRCFVDGASVGGNGYSIRYAYTNPSGTVDVHTLRSVIRHPDGSCDPLGELTGVAAEGEPGFDRGLIDSALFSGPIQATTEVRVDADLGASLEPYTAFGLSYEYVWDQHGEMRLRMSWNGKPVHSLFDTEDGKWFANNLYGSDLGSEAVDLETIYQEGRLCGLRPVSDSAAPTSQAQTAVAQGTGGGTPFEEIFAQYAPYGLSYSPREGSLGSLTWNGQAVASFADLKPDGSAFSYQVPNSEGGLRVYTQYDEDGSLTGLRGE